MITMITQRLLTRFTAWSLLLISVVCGLGSPHFRSYSTSTPLFEGYISSSSGNFGSRVYLTETETGTAGKVTNYNVYHVPVVHKHTNHHTIYQDKVKARIFHHNHEYHEQEHFKPGRVVREKDQHVHGGHSDMQIAGDAWQPQHTNQHNEEYLPAGQESWQEQQNGGFTVGNRMPLYGGAWQKQPGNQAGYGR